MDRLQKAASRGAVRDLLDATGGGEQSLHLVVGQREASRPAPTSTRGATDNV